VVGPVTIRPLQGGDEGAALEAHAEMLRDDVGFLHGWHPALGWDTYLRWLALGSAGLDQGDGIVPSTFLVAEADGQLVGRCDLRWWLTESLYDFDGHIGYAVRTAWRGRGVATAMLAHCVELARTTLDTPAVLVTCDRGNASSAAVIRRCGGVFDDERWDPRRQVHKQRYWIELR